MQKLKLDLEAIEVESFASEDVPPTPRGTVKGHAPLTFECNSQTHTWERDYTCDEYGTCYYSCYDQTCHLRDSCDGTCTWL